MNVISKLIDKLKASEGVGIVTLTDDTGDTQTAQLKTDGEDILKKARRYETYGISVRPLKGAAALWKMWGILTGHAVILAYPDSRYRKANLQEGEVCLYTDEGDYIILSRGKILKVVSGNEIDVTATNKIVATAPNVSVVASVKVTLQTPLVEATGNMTVDGNLHVEGNSSVDGTSVLTGNVTAGGNVTAATGVVTAATVAGTTDVQIGPAGKSAVSHKHTGVTVGSGVSGTMQ